jgi:hypothetical protein
MPMYVTLIRYTEQGIKTFKDLPSRLEETRKAGEAAGAKLVLSHDGSVRRRGRERGAGRRDGRDARACCRRTRQRPYGDAACLH